jgi:hypothetical protein
LIGRTGILEHDRRVEKIAQERLRCVVAADPFGRFDNEFGAIAFQAGPAWRRQAGVVDFAGCYIVEDKRRFCSTNASSLDRDLYRIARVYTEGRSSYAVGSGRIPFLKCRTTDRGSAVDGCLDCLQNASLAYIRRIVTVESDPLGDV